MDCDVPTTHICHLPLIPSPPAGFDCLCERAVKASHMGARWAGGGAGGQPTCLWVQVTERTCQYLGIPGCSLSLVACWLGVVCWLLVPGCDPSAVPSSLGHLSVGGGSWGFCSLGAFCPPVRPAALFSPASCLPACQPRPSPETSAYASHCASPARLILVRNHSALLTLLCVLAAAQY